MKKIFVFAFLFFFCNYLQAQDQSSPAARVAQHIADKMADTLGLTSQQRGKIYAINMDLYKLKAVARGKSQDRAVVGKELQAIEGTRNSLYKSILSVQQYVIYLEKKRRLVTSK